MAFNFCSEWKVEGRKRFHFSAFLFYFNILKYTFLSCCYSSWKVVLVYSTSDFIINVIIIITIITIMIMTTARQTKVNILILYKPLRKKKKCSLFLSWPVS